MNKITEWFLNQKPLTIFLLCFLGIPIYIWVFSIIYQLDKKRNVTESLLKIIVVGIITIYPIVYFSFFISIFFNLIGIIPLDLFDFIMPFHLAAMFCGFLLLIIAANSYGEFEKSRKIKTYESVGVFFMLWFYIIGVWILQPNLNKYINDK